MEESLQEVSGAIMNENKTVKKLLELQEQNNEMLSILVKHINTQNEKESGVIKK